MGEASQLREVLQSASFEARISSFCPFTQYRKKGGNYCRALTLLLTTASMVVPVNFCHSALTSASFQNAGLDIWPVRSTINFFLLSISKITSKLFQVGLYR